MVGEIIIEHDEDEDADRHLIDMTLQQSEANNGTFHVPISSSNLK